jgi:glucosamine--fructose-6-phosphate aminotransferase (isomerizing)
MECALVPCRSYSVADFEHGPRALAGPGAFLLAFSETSAALEQTGCRVERAPEPAQGALDPVWQAFYLQWLALLAARVRGYDPDRPGGLTKVTETL